MTLLAISNTISYQKLLRRKKFYAATGKLKSPIICLIRAQQIDYNVVYN